MISQHQYAEICEPKRLSMNKLCSAEPHGMLIGENELTWTRIEVTMIVNVVSQGTMLELRKIKMENQKSKSRNVAHDFGREMALPTLPTRPLVFRTPLLSVLRREGLERILLMLMLPFPLFSLGVFGRAPAGAVFSRSLSSPNPKEVCVTEVWMTDVVLKARRCLSLRVGDRAGERDDVRRAIWRRWNSSSDSPSNRVISALTSVCDFVKGSFSSMR